MGGDVEGCRLVVDHREKGVIEVLRKAKVPFETQGLDIGDAALYRGDALWCLFERKTVADLAQSVKDGRYRDQKCRMLQARGEGAVQHLVYVIEGDGFSFAKPATGSTCGLTNQALASCLVNSMFRDGVLVARTASVEETAHFIAAVWTRAPALPLRPVEEASRALSQHATLQAVLKTKKRENYTVRNICVTQLSMVPGISLCTAERILDRLGAESMADLLDALRKAPADLKCVEGVGARLSARVLEYMGVSRAPREEEGGLSAHGCHYTRDRQGDDADE